MSYSSYPTLRMRRKRQAPWIRALHEEYRLYPSDFVLPLFIHDKPIAEPIASLPNCSRHSIDSLLATIEQAVKAGIPAVALFPAIDSALKDAKGSEALNEHTIACKAVKAIKERFNNAIGVICDVALDPYTTHGHDGVLNAQGEVDNDETVALLTQQAVLLAAAGCDIVAPSDMMDGRVAAIRARLDHQGYEQVMILSYAAKYASAFYGPFRDAVGSASHLGKADKRSYQMDYSQQSEAMQEMALDIQEGADMLMVKPAMAYLDIIARASQQFDTPIWAYQVSGEYAMLQSMDNADALLLESLVACKRAGARVIISYAALDVASRLI